MPRKPDVVNGPGVEEILKTSARRQNDMLRERLAFLSGAKPEDRDAVIEAIGFLMDRGLIVPTARAMSARPVIPSIERNAPSGGIERESAQDAGRVGRKSARAGTSITDTAGEPVTSARFFEAG
jgi:hypothetical protein